MSMIQFPIFQPELQNILNIIVKSAALQAMTQGMTEHGLIFEL
jgi:hypothetical protein